MKEPEPLLHYLLGERLPPLGGAMDVAPGVKWLRMPLPFELDHINVWLLRDRSDTPQGPQEGWTVVDTGIHADSTIGFWEKIMAEELDGLPVLRVIVTHMHPDHVGLADWLCRRWQARLWMSATDYNMTRLGTLGAAGFGGGDVGAFFASHGLNDPAVTACMQERIRDFPNVVPAVPAQYVRMLDGDRLTVGAHRWHCIVGHGHSPEHMSLHSPDLGLLISGDMVLPRISTNVSVYDHEPEANALQLFLDSIDRLRALPADTLTLPSHGKPFLGLHTRIHQLHRHHQQRLDHLLQVCAEQARCAAEVMPALFHRTLDPQQTTFALGESVAHLNLLWHAGRLVRRRDADGVLRFALPCDGEQPSVLAA